jgi:hypothetical protein
MLHLFPWSKLIASGATGFLTTQFHLPDHAGQAAVGHRGSALFQYLAYAHDILSAGAKVLPHQWLDFLVAPFTGSFF